MSEPTVLPLTDRQAHLMRGVRRDGGDWSPSRARDHLACCGYDVTPERAHQIMKQLAELGHLEQIKPRAYTYRLKASVAADSIPTAALLRVWTETHRLWLASRQGAMPHQIAGPLNSAHAAVDRAVAEAEKLGTVVVTRDSDGRVTGIRAAGGNAP